MLPPNSGAWAFSASFTGTKFDIEHIADDEPENPQPYWHVQDLILSELGVTVAHGLRPNLGLEVQVPIRLVRDRVHYQDLARQPYMPPNPDLHHRNETLIGVADPQATIHVAHLGTPWTVAGRIGVSVPLGKTEPNPFELGHLGLWHQHIQFGTGTWDPVLGMAVGRSIGTLEMQLSGLARLTVVENEHSYRAGNRYSFLFGATHKLSESWIADAGLILAREEPEKWDGYVEEEGNLGRTDLLLSLGAGRGIVSLGAVVLSLQIPLLSETTGEQVKIPVVVSVVWTR